MLEIYQPISNLDWMNYKLVRKDITFHHIQKHENGGKRTVDNGALLMRVGHNYLHTIEHYNLPTYVAINKMFKYINSQHHEPTEEQRQVIEYFLQQFEEEFEGERSKKGKLIVKSEYLKRKKYVDN